MGCDIHVHVEVKINGFWNHYNQRDFDRNYELFSRMADVRNGAKCTDDYTEPIADPRGLPEDVTFMTKFDSDNWGVDGHSHSWLSRLEVLELMEWVVEQHKKYGSKEWFSPEHHMFGYIFGNGWDIGDTPGEHPEGVEDARLVFWFDN